MISNQFTRQSLRLSHAVHLRGDQIGFGAEDDLSLDVFSNIYNLLMQVEAGQEPMGLKTSVYSPNDTNTSLSDITSLLSHDNP